MAQATWEKSANPELARLTKTDGRWKFLASSTGAQFFIAADEAVNNPEYVGQTVRVSGEAIVYNPEEFGDLAQGLHDLVINPGLPVYIENEVMPDLLQHEAQAIFTGTLHPDGVFYSTAIC